MPVSFKSTRGDPVSVTRSIQTNLQPTQDDMRYVAERQKARIIARTGKGVDAKGQSFAVYSDKYKKRKEKSGRNSGIVDLTWSGRMLKALVTRSVTPKSFTIGIYGEEGTRGSAHNTGAGHMPLRKFFDMTAADFTAAKEDLRLRILARLKGSN